MRTCMFSKSNCGPNFVVGAYLPRFRVSPVLCAILCWLLWACGSSHEQSSSRPELLYWSANNPYEQELAREIVAKWHALHPDKRVHYQPIPEGQSSEEVILAAIVGRTT